MRLDSTFAEAFYLRAFTHSHLEDKEKATEDFATVVRLRPQAVDAWYNLAILHAIQGQYTSALEAHRKVEAIDPSYKDNRAKFSALLEKLKR
ncbi:MAG: tetratricopeptide repeat protein [Bacteroidota bacterium]